jgi:hypothetical protein
MPNVMLDLILVVVPAVMPNVMLDLTPTAISTVVLAMAVVPAVMHVDCGVCRSVTPAVML